MVGRKCKRKFFRYFRGSSGSSLAYGLPERDATITRHEVQNAVAEQLSEHNDTALLERLTDAVLAHRGGIALNVGVGPRERQG